MKPSEDKLDAIFEPTQCAWKGERSKLLIRFLQLWKKNRRLERVGNDGVVALLDMSEIPLRGMHEVPCLLLAEVGRTTADQLGSYRNRFGSAAAVPFIAVFSQAIAASFGEFIPQKRFLILNATQIQQITESHNPHDFIKRELRQQIPLRRLIPYNYLQAALGSMFFGRHHEIDRLRYETDTSIAVAGPGRIGKTSLIQEYRYRMILEHDPATSRRHYIDFYDCDGKTEDRIARFVAMKIAPGARSNRVTASSLINFMRYQRNVQGGPLDLLLDEVDEVCESQTFRQLGAAARKGLCRLVICGRAELFKLALRQDSPLECRLDLLRLNPLDPQSARRLVENPLKALGFRILDPDDLVEYLFRMSGRLPHMLQFYGRRLASLAIEQGSDTISSEQAELLADDLETANYFASPLFNVKDKQSRYLALVLVEADFGRVSASALQDLASRQGLDITPERALEICNDLVLNNVLAWRNGAYFVANEALAFYTRKLGVLQSELERARLQVT